MNRTVLLNLVVTLLVVAGCAGTGMKVQTAYTPTPGASITYTVDPKVEMSTEAMGIFKQRLESQFGTSGLLAAGKPPARSVEIVITNYYMRHGATRALVGILAGADNMQSSITVRDTKTKAVIGQFAVESTNPTAMFTSRGMIEEHADKIVRYVSSGSQ